MRQPKSGPLVAIACGGTGGHLFPAIAIGGEILLRGGRVILLVSNKDIENELGGGFSGFEAFGLPAIGLTRGSLLPFISGCIKSFRRCAELFRAQRPDGVLAMGGFTSAPPILAGRRCGAKTFLHEANTLPGRANRWLSYFVDEAFVFFDETSGRLNLQKVEVTGMPVRPQFQPMHPASARLALGLKPDIPLLLVMGGSQGASGINQLVCDALPAILAEIPRLQFLHLTGAADFEKVRAFYKACPCQAMVRPFLTEMELALGGATLAISRSGASSLAELAAMGIPAILIPYPNATDDHQLFNALAFSSSGAAVLLEQHATSAATLAAKVIGLISDARALARMSQAISVKHQPDAAVNVAQRILACLPPVKTPGSTGRKNPTANLALAVDESRAR